MFFASPLWLLALLPWAALTIWTLRHAATSTLVPFVQLWQSSDVVSSTSTRRRWRRPPLPILFLLAAMLACICATAQPMVRRAGEVGPITIILDRSVQSNATEAAWNQFAADAQDKILHTFGPGRCRFICVPGALLIESIDRNDLARSIAKNSSTALDTNDALSSAIASTLQRDSQSVVIVLSNQTLAMINPRVQQIATRTSTKNIAITHLGISDSPKPAAMVRLRNDGFAGTNATLSIAIDGKSVVEKTVELPASGSERDEFIDLPKRGDAIRTSIEVSDDIPIDNVAFAAREMAWPRIEPAISLPGDLKRLIDTYKKLRPPTAGSVSVAINDAVRETKQPSVTIAPSRVRLTEGALTVADHPIARHIGDWKAILADASIAKEPPPGAGWTPVIRMDEKIVLATRTEPGRQVWVGFDSPQFAQRPDFVVFWSDILSWLGGENGTGSWASREIVELNDSWQRDVAISGKPLSNTPSTGIYRSENGEISARSLLPNLAELPTNPRPLSAELLLNRLDRPLATAFLWIASTGVLLAALTLTGIRRRN